MTSRPCDLRAVDSLLGARVLCCRSATDHITFVLLWFFPNLSPVSQLYHPFCFHIILHDHFISFIFHVVCICFPFQGCLHFAGLFYAPRDELYSFRVYMWSCALLGRCASLWTLIGAETLPGFVLRMGKLCAEFLSTNQADAKERPMLPAVH